MIDALLFWIYALLYWIEERLYWIEALLYRIASFCNGTVLKAGRLGASRLGCGASRREAALRAAGYTKKTVVND